MDEFPTLPPGTLIAGKLRLIRMLGSGGMGVVYEVEHEITKHRRALKVLHAYAAEQPGVVERFLREASAAGRVGNAHVAETFDAGKLDSGEPYLLMELLDGETLDTLLQRMGPLDPGLLCDLICQACEGVQAAHEAGIIHRDLKPENLMIVMRDNTPFVKILDFGISKFDAERTGSMKLTTEGLVMGTPYYMSPEQVRGSSTIDARTDIYALGVILYECATAARPFDAATVQHLAVLIHEGKPLPLSARRAGLPPAFYEIVNCAMAADREKRFATASDLGAALAPLRTRGPAHATRFMPTARTHIVVDTTGGGPPRVTSSRPAGPVPSTDAALSATMSKPPTGGRSRVLGASAAIVLLAGGAAAFAFMRPAPAPTSLPPTPAASQAAVEPAPDAAPAAQAASAEPAAVASASANASPSAAAPPEHAPPVLHGVAAAAIAGNTNTRPALSASAAPLVVAPVAPPVQKGHVQDNGLSRENPFR